MQDDDASLNITRKVLGLLGWLRIKLGCVYCPARANTLPSKPAALENYTQFYACFPPMKPVEVSPLRVGGRY